MIAWLLLVIVVVAVVVVVVLVTTVGGGGDNRETNAIAAEQPPVPTENPTTLYFYSGMPSLSAAPSFSSAPSTVPSTSMAPSTVPSTSQEPSISPTRSVSAMELMLRTNYPEVFEQEDKAILADHDESAYWMKALRFVEETSSKMADWRIAQRYALTCIYYATNGVSTPYYVENFMNENDTDVPEWSSRIGWAERADTTRECGWAGVECKDLVIDPSNILNTESHVISIVLDRKLLLVTGTFPIEVIILKETLEELRIVDCPVSNNVLEDLWWLGELAQMRELVLRRTGFGYDQGLPLELGSLTNLERLDVSYSLFRGRLDAKTAFQNLSSLEYLSLSGLNFTNPITLFDSLSSLHSLTTLRMSDISFQGALSFKFSELANLRRVSIENADLTGTLDVILSDNSFTGYETDVRQLFLSGNPNLRGTLPRTIGLFSELTDLRLENCGLTGQIPAELGWLQKVRYVQMGNNAFNGTFPSNFGNLSSLGTLYLQDNNSTGGLDAFLGDHRDAGYSFHLTSLNLTNNYLLGGSIPTSVGLFTDLRRLVLGNCDLTGPVPSQIGLLHSLLNLDLHDNTLNGTIPSQLGEITSLGYGHVQLHYNDLTGAVPQSICELPQDDFDYVFTTDCSTPGKVSCEIPCCTMCY